jgi:hypothetical protein
MQISKKAIRKINFLISNVISLNNVEEFQESRHEKLFKGPPDTWESEENAICDYQGRIINELRNGLEKILGIKF